MGFSTARCVRPLPLIALVTVILAPSSPAHAQRVPQFVLWAEAAGTVVLPEYQRSDLGQVAGAYLAARLGVRLFEPVAIQAS
jgi:hypothetical protein